MPTVKAGSAKKDQKDDNDHDEDSDSSSDDDLDDDFKEPVIKDFIGNIKEKLDCKKLKYSKFVQKDNAAVLTDVYRNFLEEHKLGGSKYLHKKRLILMVDRRTKE
eukprot:378134_1